MPTLERTAQAEEDLIDPVSRRVSRRARTLRQLTDSGAFAPIALPKGVHRGTSMIFSYS